ncbi:Mitochondrial import inner membrane translocase subunit TIM50 [Desmophyllum pertusum]|uniref:Mitochondrial import inner membrane translocase subunit TIM50 n=1 Tax=Desmophyllum pertusum TaxID=174260 RepID=A0A9X0CHB6_9CNID|nr:Mitochondrial import inner membrane translocase subunit TIM50 [Desmophyllum pertusum]
MAVAVSSSISSCCRWFSSRICSNASLIAPVVRFSSLSCTGRVLRPPARLPLRCPRAFYYVKPKEKKGPSLRSWIMFGAGCVGMVAGAVVYVGWPESGPDYTEDPYKNEPVPMQYMYRARDKIWDFYEMFAQPSSKMLLPEPLQEPYFQPPYTLVLELKDVLVHPEYDRKSGWRFRKRPGVDAFLNQLGPPLFEVVIYTHEAGFSASPVVDGLDPNGMIMYRLFRDATLYTDGTHVKDLSALNRDLSKVIMIDCDEKAPKDNLRNAVILKKWEGDPTDKILYDLIPFLQTIATSNVEDIRTVLDFYRQEDDVVEAFKRNQARLTRSRRSKITTTSRKVIMVWKRLQLWTFKQQ